MGGGYAAPRRVNYGWIGESWQLFTQAAGAWILLLLANVVVSLIISFGLQAMFPNTNYTPPTPGASPWQVMATSQKMSSLGQFLSYVISWLTGGFFAACFYGLAVKQVRGQAVGVGDAFGGGPYYGQMLLATLVLGLLAGGGALVFCLGFFVVLGLMLPMQAMVADGVPAMEAISRSFEAMKADWLSAALFYIVMFLLILVSAIPCGLGLLATAPMTYLIAALAYRDMVGMPGANSGFTPNYGAPQPGVWPPPPGAGNAPPYGGQPGNYPQGGQPGAWPPPQGGQPGAWPPPQGGPQFGQPPQGGPQFGQPPSSPGAQPPGQWLGGSPPDDPNRPQGGA
ncbi:hypothetical protein CCAX7_22550 [Capsulimonas corticalis]|uniref:Glycerophosphoryl diester phosphodiesterase membrane domain-containing protein n=2 Tax=Capsulimonas corticalis TaxID=2219043 RepID=A0A9N7Q9V9_9BACT|nr:hypothetical protein CCAX7_22550 [Capsulimonas corticalis]